MNTSLNIHDLQKIAETQVKFEICDNNDHQTKKVLVIYFSENTKYLTIDEELIYVLEQLNLKRTFQDVFSRFKEKYNYSDSIQELFDLFKSTVVYTYLFEKNEEFNAIKKDKYIYPKINLLSSETVNSVAKRIAFFFNKSIFWYAFFLLPIVLLFCFHSLNIGFKSLYDYIDLNTTIIFYFSYILCVLIHEFGHAAATVYHGAKPNQIGFGFYLISPVFFCDVSDIWRLNKKKRIVVDLGGIYFQWIVSLVFCGLFLLTTNKFFIIFSFFNFISSLINLNPFLLYDGYWALSDISGISNLREKSFKELKVFITSLIRFRNSIKSLKSAVIVLYAILSFGMLVMFFYYMIFVNTDSILYFFYNIYSFIKQIIVEFNSINFATVKSSLVSFIAPSIFYWLTIKLIIKNLKKWTKN